VTASAVGVRTVQVPVHVVVPGDIDDPTRPSGGNAYDRQVCLALAAAGRPVHEIAVGADWPEPDAAARAELDRNLAAVPDDAVVLLDGLVACAVPDVLGPHALRLRLVVLVHLPLGDEAGLPLATAADRTVRERAALHAATAVVATSPWTAARLRTLHGLPAERVHVAVPGVDPAPLADPDETGSRLLCVGSITPTKGQDLLVEALARIADRRWTCRLVGPLTRDPAAVAAVREAVRRHGLDDRVEIAGPRTGAALDAAYASTDLLVLPSRAETYGMVLTEALARGIPVLAAAVGGVPGTVGRTAAGDLPGLLVPAADVPGLAATLRRWLDDPGLRRSARAAARLRRAELPGWEVTARCLTDVLRLTDVPGPTEALT
jgi:glycosyltransferase involved in cell wall biosynthesis